MSLILRQSGTSPAAPDVVVLNVFVPKFLWCFWLDFKCFLCPDFQCFCPVTVFPFSSEALSLFLSTPSLARAKIGCVCNCNLYHCTRGSILDLNIIKHTSFWSWAIPSYQPSLLLFRWRATSSCFADIDRHCKGTFQKRFSGIRPLRGGGVPPFSAKEKNLLFFTLIFR